MKMQTQKEQARLPNVPKLTYPKEHGKTHNTKHVIEGGKGRNETIKREKNEKKRENSETKRGKRDFDWVEVLGGGIGQYANRSLSSVCFSSFIGAEGNKGKGKPGPGNGNQ